jgi:hypothetical protein
MKKGKEIYKMDNPIWRIEMNKIDYNDRYDRKKLTIAEIKVKLNELNIPYDNNLKRNQLWDLFKGTLRQKINEQDMHKERLKNERYARNRDYNLEYIKDNHKLELKPGCEISNQELEWLHRNLRQCTGSGKFQPVEYEETNHNIRINDIKVDEYTIKFINDDDEVFIDIGISSGRECCEHPGIVVNPENVTEFKGSYFKNIKYDTRRCVEHKRSRDSYCERNSDLFIITLGDNKEILVEVFNEHNGYYSHSCWAKGPDFDFDDDL